MIFQDGIQELENRCKLHNKLNYEQASLYKCKQGSFFQGQTQNRK